jgi:RND family efflux transporter MFP subunit
MTIGPARFLVAALTIAALSASSACGDKPPEEIDSATVVSVKTTPAAVGTIRGLVHATAIVNPAPGAEFLVIPPEPARIAEIPHAAGDRVGRGDLLVRFEIPNAQAEVRRQEAEVLRGQATLDNARKAQARARQLFDRGVAAGKEVEDANRVVADADAALAQARASLAAAQTVAARAVVRAPFDGIVATRLHNPGDLVEATAGDPVLRVIDPHRLEVVAAVPLADAPRIVIGAAAHLTATPIGGPEIRLTVVSRPAAVDTATPTIPVRLASPDLTRFPAGTPVEIEIEAEQHTDVVLVPDVAVLREGDETAVFVASGSKAQRRTVELGLTDGTHAEVRSGVKAGEQVIVDGQAGLPDGAAIAVSEAK